MKKKMTIFRMIAFVVVAFLVVSLSGCAGIATSMSDRINAFIGAVNSESWTSIRGLCDSGAQNYNTANTEAYWSNYFTPGNTYAVSGISESGSSATATITGSPEYTNGVTFTFTFTEKKGGLFEGSTFNIRTIAAGSTTIFN